jgi:acetyl esterase/lipase
VLGFSAGGHLTIMASTHFDGGIAESADPVERESCRPNAHIPCYPLVTFKPLLKVKSEQAWLQKAFGPDYSDDSMRWSYGEQNVRMDTPPAFFWGTWDDFDFLYAQWPPYLKALKRKKIEYEFHMFPHGGHGMGLAKENPLASQWTALCAAWLKELGFQQ